MCFTVTQYWDSMWVNVSEDVNTALSSVFSGQEENFCCFDKVKVFFFLSMCCPQVSYLEFFFSIKKLSLHHRSSPIHFKFHYWVARELRTLLPCCTQVVKNEWWNRAVCFAAFSCHTQFTPLIWHLSFAESSLTRCSFQRHRWCCGAGEAQHKSQADIPCAAATTSDRGWLKTPSWHW